MPTILMILPLGLALFLGGCTLAPKVVLPESPVASQWPATAAAPTLAASFDPAALDWRQFAADPALQRLIEMALEGNRDLRLACLAVERTRALYGVQRSELFPAISGTAAGSRQRHSVDLLGDGQPTRSEHYAVDLGVLAWEIDFFGRIRSLKDEAMQQYLASEQGRRGAQILLVATVAETYLTLAADLDGLTLARQTLQTQQDSYGLVRRQAEQALVTELDVRRAQIPVETARADLARYSLRVAQDRHALDLLVGSAVPEALLPRGLSQVAVAREVVPGLPSEVLLRRPDVLAAEHQLRAAHAIIGAARAAFFPRLALTSTVGTASNELSNLFENGRGTWAFAPALSMPIFDARVWSAYRVSGVQREIAVAQYERAIQSAFREVADALALRRMVAEQRAAQEDLVEALTETHRLALMRFERGIDSYLSVLDAQRSLFAGQQALIGVQLAERLSQVQLFAALGGGWQAPSTAAVGAGS